MPERIQRSRAKGWTMPADAIYVGRTAAGRSWDYGNRYAIGETVRHVDDTIVLVRDRAHAVQLYREWFAWQQRHGYPPDLSSLRGHDLACWCPLDQPCHADVLLELANVEPLPLKVTAGRQSTPQPGSAGEDRVLESRPAVNPKGHPARWCVHYISPLAFEIGEEHLEREACAAGVRYDTWSTVPFAQRPCFLDDRGQSKPGAVECPKLRRPTAEEIAERKEHDAKAVARLISVMTAIWPWRKEHAGQVASETVECPACKGRLHLSIAKNGHVAGWCATEGCVQWIE